MVTIVCSRCQKASLPEAQFCAFCGKSLVAKKTPWLSIFATALVVGGGIWGLKQLTAIGTPPEETFASFRAKQGGVPTASGENPHGNSGHQGSPAGGAQRDPQVLEKIDELRGVLAQNPHDQTALLALADLTFEQQLYEISLQYYEKFLVEDPKNVEIRARYASVLTLLKKFDRAEVELSKNIKQEKKHFPSYAYRTINFAEQGKFPEALAAGELALKFAPSEEARQEFSRFLARVQQRSQSGTSAPAAVVAAAAPEAKDLEAFIRNHPILAAKFVALERKGTEAKIIVHDFPMDQMPPFAKESLIKKLSAQAPEVRQFVFMDQGSGKVLETFTAPSSK